jgi:hypothetical protein
MLCRHANTPDVGRTTDICKPREDHQRQRRSPTPPSKGINMTDANDDTATNEADDKQAHGFRFGIRNDDTDDTEGNCFKYRDGVPEGRPDDTQGHSVKAGHLEPAGDDIEVPRAKNPS